MARKLETFRCSIKVRGEQCPCEMTVVNTSVFSTRTLGKSHPEGVTLDTIASNAICPWHARLLMHHRGDVCTMASVLEKFRKMVHEARGEWYWEKRDLVLKARTASIAEASMPAIQRAMKIAGISQGSSAQA